MKEKQKAGIFQKWRNILGRFGGKGTYPHELSFLLDFPLRRLLLSPETLANRLHLRENSLVLEVGPGPGFFSREVARRLPRGRLILTDIQGEMLLKARKKITKAGLTNVGFVQANAVFLPFKNNRCDIIFLVTVLGEIADPSAFLHCSFQVLRPGGLLSITEQRGDPDALPLSALCSLTAKQGFELLKVHGKAKNFTANFRKPLTSQEKS